MTKWWMNAGLMVALLLGGCAPSEPPPPPEPPPPQVVIQKTDAELVLTCLQETKTLSHADFRKAYKEAAKQATAGAENDASLRHICLSLHPFARYTQFRAGVQTLDTLVQSEREEAGGLHGLQLLMRRMDKEKVTKWGQKSRWSEERENLAEENKALFERNSHLETTIEQDQGRIRDLQAQIEQLKNIENIIKHRDR